MSRGNISLRQELSLSGASHSDATMQPIGLTPLRGVSLESGNSSTSWGGEGLSCRVKTLLNQIQVIFFSIGYFIITVNEGSSV